MKKIFANLFMGLTLIVLGTLFLLNNLDIIYIESSLAVAAIAFVLGISFFFYYTTDRSLWWPFIPSIILFTISALVLLSYFDIDDEWLGSIFFWGTGLAFLAVYLKQRSNTWALIPFWASIVLGFVVLAEYLTDIFYWMESGLGGSVLFFGGALAFLAYYLKRKVVWWPLFISLVLFTLSATVVVGVTYYHEDLAGSVFLWGAGISFISIFIKKRAYWWAVIPGGSMLVLGLFPMMVTFSWGWDLLYAFIFFFGIGLVFASLYFIKVEGKRLTWAKTPALLLIAFSFFLLIFAQETTYLRFLLPIFLFALGILLIAKYAKNLKKELR